MIIAFPSRSYSTPEYAEETGFDCQRCHAEPGGGELTKAGEDFMEGLKTRGQYRPIHPAKKIIRLITGYIHLLTAIAWFGTILYVHILLKPAYAAKGVPKGELFLGWLGIIILSITGVILTMYRIPDFKMLYTTRFGILLSIKIFLFLIMVSTAVIVTFVIGPKLKRNRALVLPQNKTMLTPEDISNFDGKDNSLAYIAYKGKVYDVSSSKSWKDGSHFTKHFAGSDLTDLLKTAPHGEEKILRMPEVAALVPSGTKAGKPPHEKVFYFMAYMNLGFVFLITFIMALWRWW